MARLKKTTTKYSIGGTVGGVAGAAIGQALIPIPGVGAMVGKAAGTMLGNAVQNRIAPQQLPAEQLAQPIIQQGINHLATQAFANGGQLTQYQGNTHENGGILLGQTGNEVEDGETRNKDYIFSDRLIGNKKKKQTYAQMSKDIEKKYKGRDNDKWAKEAKQKELDNLRNVQEIHRQKVMNDAYQKAYDNETIKYNIGGYIPPYNENDLNNELRTSANDIRNNRYVNKSNSVSNTNNNVVNNTSLNNTSTMHTGSEQQYLNGTTQGIQFGIPEPTWMQGYPTGHLIETVDVKPPITSNVNDVTSNNQQLLQRPVYSDNSNLTVPINEQSLIGNPYGQQYTFKNDQIPHGKGFDNSTNVISNVATSNNNNINDTYTPEKDTEVIEWFDNLPATEKSKIGNLIGRPGLSNLSGLAVTQMGNLYDIYRGIKGGDPVNIGRLNAVELEQLDPTRAIQLQQESAAGTNALIRQQGGQGLGTYMSNIGATNARTQGSIGTTQSSYDEANVGIRNQNRLGRQQTQLQNINLSSTEADLRQQEKDIASNTLQYGLAGLSAGAAMNMRDTKLDKTQKMLIDSGIIGTNDYMYIDENGNYKLVFKGNKNTTSTTST